MQGSARTAARHAITSFTVSRRTREIAVRVALGAQISNVIANVFRGPFLQVAVGVAVGCVMIGPLLRVFRVEPTDVLRDDG